LEENKEAVATPQKLSLDRLAQIAESKYPNEKVRYAFWDENEKNKILFDVVDRPDAPYEKSKYLVLNEYTGEILGAPKTDGLMHIILKLHTELFLGVMGILFMISIISGIVLYGPIMKKYDFGMVRKNKSKRLQWLDTHNLLGIALTAWMVVVGFTGVINTLSDVILGLWQQGQLAEMTAPYKNQQPLTGNFSSLEEAKKAAERTITDMKVSVIAYPGTPFTSKHHYAVFMRGNTELTSKLLRPVLIDAKSGSVTDTREMPWYVNTLFLSEPLHFGNYGGPVLKIVWAVFDVFTIIVLITGLYLWLARRRAEKQQQLLISKEPLS